MSLSGLLLFLCCSIPTKQEILETFVLLENGDLFESKFIKSDTGIYKGQGKLTVNRWFKSQTPLSFGFYANDIDTSISLEHANVGTNQMRRITSGWTLQVRSSDLNASTMMTAQKGPTVEIDDWTTTIIGGEASFTGWISAAQRSTPMNGDGIILHHAGINMPTSNRTLMMASGATLSLGIDHHPPKSIAWGYWDDLSLDDRQIEIQETENGLLISAKEWSLTFVVENRFGQIDPHEHLFLPERIIASPWINDNIEARYSGIVIIEADGRKNRATAVMKRHETKPLEASIIKSKKLSEELEAQE